MRTINVKFKDLGFFTETPITVTSIYEGDIERCNHAGAIYEEQEVVSYRPDGSDIVWTTTIQMCDKCGAFKNQGENYWELTPPEGDF